MSDVMGRTYHELELHNKWAGQFFTPDVVCRMMAQMTIADRVGLATKIKEQGFVTAQEPAVGSGAMVVALAKEMYDAGINYQQHLHVTAIDIDLKCVHMAYLQFSLLHIPAVIIHGDTLNLKPYSQWYTPAHMMGSWDWKLLQLPKADARHEVEAPPAPTPVPTPANTDIPAKPEPQPKQLKLF